MFNLLDIITGIGLVVIVVGSIFIGYILGKNKKNQEEE